VPVAAQRHGSDATDPLSENRVLPAEGLRACRQCRTRQQVQRSIRVSSPNQRPGMGTPRTAS
jgi:hypothetical protein